MFTTSVSADHGDHRRWRDPGAERTVRLLQLHGPGALPERDLAGPGPGELGLVETGSRDQVLTSDWTRTSTWASSAWAGSGTLHPSPRTPTPPASQNHPANLQTTRLVLTFGTYE